MTILFPKDPIHPSKPDPDYATEFEAAANAGFRCALFSLEALRAGDARSSLAPCAVATESGEWLTHRCWMMSDSLYATLHAGLVELGYAPQVSPDAYAEAHYLPLAFTSLSPHTADSRWMEGRDEESAWRLFRDLESDAIIKDWVKSAKHRWRDACFIPAGTTRERFGEIFQNFLAARGALFEKGIVFRRFHHLAQLCEDMKGQPVHEEYRMFFFRGELLAVTSVQGDEGPMAQIDKWTSIARKFASPFVTIDVAREVSGGWLIIESGDAGVSGLPVSIEPEHFFRSLRLRTAV
ncbi:MAG: hypothetical protein RL088_193 [Verrucomicrobiota bacterium]|jgi:hypothetical protein